MHRHLPFLITAFLAPAIFSDQLATTEAGKKVILLDNGSWRYLNTEKEKPAEGSGVDQVSMVEIVKNDKGFDFRKARWGMDKKEVIASEDAQPLLNTETILEYKVRLLGYDCTVSYNFSDKKLLSARFVIRQPHVDPALYFEDYEELTRYLSPLYGKTVSKRCDWKNEMYRDDRSKWGFAVSLGFLTCSTQWQNERTRILLTISGGNHQILTDLEYTGHSTSR